MIKSIKFSLMLVVSIMCFSSCDKVVNIGISSSPSKMKKVPGNKVSPLKALEFAKPHLQKSWELGCEHHKDRKHWCVKRADRAQVHIVQKGDFYYFRKTSYPFKTLTAYLYYAVKVNVNSGRVIPPKD